MWFDTWTDLGRVLIVGPLAYAALVAVLRISGARSLSKLNAFDLVVTVALGSTLATVLLNGSVSLAEGVLGLVVLVLLQYLVSRLSLRWGRDEVDGDRGGVTYRKSARARSASRPKRTDGSINTSRAC